VVYQFQIQQRDVRPAAGASGRPNVAVHGWEDDALPEGNIILGGEQIVDRDLSFMAQSANLFTEWRLRVTPKLPRPMRGRNLQLAFIGAYNALLAVFAYYMLVTGPGVTWSAMRERRRHGPGSRDRG
jgi:hypothetical protein